MNLYIVTITRARTNRHNDIIGHDHLDVALLAPDLASAELLCKINTRGALETYGYPRVATVDEQPKRQYVSQEHNWASALSQGAVAAHMHMIAQRAW